SVPASARKRSILSRTFLVCASIPPLASSATTPAVTTAVPESGYSTTWLMRALEWWRVIMSFLPRCANCRGSSSRAAKDRRRLRPKGGGLSTAPRRQRKAHGGNGEATPTRGRRAAGHGAGRHYAPAGCRTAGDWRGLSRATDGDYARMGRDSSLIRSLARSQLAQGAS